MKSLAETLVVGSGERSPAAEAYRVLRTNLQFGALDARTLLVTSANPREGKSTTTANLAAAIAQTGQRVIVVDADLRWPSQHHIFGLSNGVGLTSALLAPSPEVTRFIQPTGLDGLSVLTSGPLPPNPSELLGSWRMEAVVAALKQAADIVLFDSPPLLAVADASILAGCTDGTIMVIDGAHNVSAAEALRHGLDSVFPGSRCVFVVGITADKDLAGILNALHRQSDGAPQDRLVATRSQQPRSAPTADVASKARDAGFETIEAPTVENGLRLARSMAGPTDVVVVAGSLYVVAEARKTLGLETEEDAEPPFNPWAVNPWAVNPWAPR